MGEAIKVELKHEKKTRKNTKVYISTERRNNLFQLLYGTIFSGGITLCELNEQMSCTATHIIMDVIYNIDIYTY